MKRNLMQRLLCLFTAMALCFVSLSPAASASVRQTEDAPTTCNVDRVAQVTVQSPQGEETTTQLFLTENAQLDKSWFARNGYKVTAFSIRPVNDADRVDLQTFSLTNAEKGAVGTDGIDTIYDVGCLILSLAEFKASPSTWGAFKIVVDAAAVILPGVPAISGVERMIKKSTVLKQSLQIEINKYGRLKNVTIPTGWERHHIFEKRFAKVLETTEYSMLAMAIPKEVHQKITTKMAQKIKTNQNYTKLEKKVILKAHEDAYQELHKETGDETYKFLYEFVRKGQHSGK